MKKYFLVFEETQLVTLEGQKNKSLPVEVKAESYAFGKGASIEEIKENFNKGLLDNFEFGIEPDEYPNGEYVLDVLSISNRKIKAFTLVKEEETKQVKSEPKKISINGAFRDCITGIVEATQEEEDIPDWMLTKEVILNSDNSKEELISALKDAVSFEILDNSISCVINRKEEEFEDYSNYKKDYLDYELKRLKSWFELKPEYKNEIETYLKFKNLDWILAKIDGSEEKESYLNKLVKQYDNTELNGIQKELLDIITDDDNFNNYFEHYDENGSFVNGYIIVKNENKIAVFEDFRVGVDDYDMPIEAVYRDSLLDGYSIFTSDGYFPESMESKYLKTTQNESSLNNLVKQYDENNSYDNKEKEKNPNFMNGEIEDGKLTKGNVYAFDFNGKQDLGIFEYETMSGYIYTPLENRDIYRSTSNKNVSEIKEHSTKADNFLEINKEAPFVENQKQKPNKQR